jgi:hypothetical protein
MRTGLVPSVPPLTRRSYTAPAGPSGSVSAERRVRAQPALPLPPGATDLATGASAYPAADNTFNAVTFDPVTTTRLRVVLESGQGSVGVIQWVVPSVPGSGAANPAKKRGSQ